MSYHGSSNSAVLFMHGATYQMAINYLDYGLEYFQMEI